MKTKTLRLHNAVTTQIFQRTTGLSQLTIFPPKKIFSTLAAGFLICFTTATLAISAPTVIPKAPTLSANSFYLVDFNSGSHLAEKNIHQQIEPASLTKMMTAYVVELMLKSEKIQFDELVTISHKAWKTPGSRMFVEVNKQVPVKELLQGMIIQSGNDASVALAEHIAGTEAAFAELMNFTADKLGMTETHFVNATGLPGEDHYTTAYDLGLLAQALIRDFPESYEFYSHKWFTFNGIKQRNRNQLLWRNKHVDGIKTGHTESAGYCLVASAKEDDMRLISVVTGTNSDNERTVQSQALLTYGFRFFETDKLYTADQTLSEPRAWMGKQKTFKLGLEQDLFVTIAHGQYKQLNATMHIDPEIKAPLSKGDKLGFLNVELEGKLITKVPLVALEDVEQGGLLSRLSDYVMLQVHKLVQKISG